MAAAGRSTRILALAVAAVACSAACNDSPLQDRLHSAEADTDAGHKPDPNRPSRSDAAVQGHAGSDEPAASHCIPAQSSDALRARSNVMAHSTKTSASGVFTADLFGLFQSNCGGCHVDNSLGGFHVALTTFPSVVTQEAVDRISSDKADFYMPPQGGGGKPFSQRKPGDPIVELANLLTAWLAAGRPADVFYPAQGASSDANDPNRYLLSEAVGTQMTNLGNCIPEAKMVVESPDQDDKLDAMFEKATELPDRLEQTDLVTLDSEALARQGVVAFAPAYTLWADNAKKVRMIRVPRGKSIEFDAKTQSFAIPPNTRFYKTFMKHVVDIRGNESYRKMETRLIVSRPDAENKDGSRKQTALFGTYAWNEEETEAVLVRDPLRNGEPFRDRLVTYVTDEQAAENLITTGPDDLQLALQNAGLSRTYAIPGSERCIQCHMGAPTKSFVLGFSPLQLHRRKQGQSGVIEPAERDELNQLQRLIDYGIITGMKSPDEVALLEDSQADRKPRNEHELEAQGYMLGNCSHCHNPRGYPSVIAPELRDVLNFFPSKAGGIFQFPLEKFSPRIFRGTFQNIPQPYITPSLYDRSPGTNVPEHPPELEINAGPAGADNYAQKEIQTVPPPIDPAQKTYLFAPWRSLIYRNVDTPFTYEEDFSIYPHMPMNTPGYDCRVRQLLGSWMTSIPSRVKENDDFKAGRISLFDLESTHAEAQPYVEVSPDDPDYSRQVRIGEARTTKFQNSLRYVDCPDPNKIDIVDPAVIRGDRLVPAAQNQVFYDDQGEIESGYGLRTPEREHYAVTDLTNPPGDWFPRRPDWSKVIVDLNFDGINDVVLKQRVQTLHGVVISDELRALALTEVPFGLWKVKDGCDLGSMPKMSDFDGAARPRWADVVHAKDDDRVYSISPGAEIFTQICSNCHGPEADSKGRLAATIADMTGGQTRVANLRDGFFGPTAKPGANRERVFGATPGGEDAETWGARYLMFMGLGGTQRTIPKPALQTIRNGSVLGETRPNASSLDVSTANMLSVPLALCKALLPSTVSIFLIETGDLDYSAEKARTPLIEANGDLELWRKLCMLDNEAVPVRVVSAAQKAASLEYEVSATYLRRASAYPVDAVVGDATGHVQVGIHADNLAPWCFDKPADAAVAALLVEEWAKHTGDSSEPPYCPPAFLTNEQGENHNLFTDDDAERWATRGAMNAGMSVFLYLNALAKGDKQHPIPYDRCDQIPH